MSKKFQVAGWISLAVILLGLLGFIGYYVATVDRSNELSSVEPTATTEQDVVAALESLIEEEEKTEPTPGESSTILDPVRDNGNEFGVASRVFSAVSSSFTVEVIATLGAPQSGNVYEAYLENNDASVELGVLIREVENTYAISFSTEENISRLVDIVVYEVGQSRTEVLQGTFE